MSGQPTAADNEGEVTKKFKELWVEYKMAMVGEYFANKNIGSSDPALPWEGPYGITAYTKSPLQTFLGVKSSQQQDPPSNGQ